MDPAREPRDPVPEGQPGTAEDRTDATRAPAPPRVVFEVLAEPPPKPMKRIEFAIDGRAAEEEEAQRMSMREWFAGAGADVLTYDQVMARLPPPLPRDDLCGNKIYGAFVLNRRVDLHAIDATPARWRGGVGSSPLDGTSAATSSPRNDLVKNCRCTRHTG